MLDATQHQADLLGRSSLCGLPQQYCRTWHRQQARCNGTHDSRHPCAAGIPKLDDANDAGTKASEDCTLILTEGDSAKALAVAGLSVVGRNRYGVFPLRCGQTSLRSCLLICKHGCSNTSVMT